MVLVWGADTYSVGITDIVLAMVTVIIVNFPWTILSKGEGAMRLTLCESSTRETRPDHNTGN